MFSKTLKIQLILLSIFVVQSRGEIKIITNIDGKKYYVYHPYSFEYSNTDNDEVLIEFSSDSGSTWSPADAYNFRENNGNIKFNWFIPYISSSKCKLKIIEANNTSNFTMNEGIFRIIPIHTDYIAINEIKMLFSNDGTGSHDPNLDWSGLFWPGGPAAIKGAAFDDGLIWAGNINGEIRANGSVHRTGLRPGNITENNTAADPINEEFHIRKIEKSPSNLYSDRNRILDDYNDWPVYLGAPWIDNNNDGFYTKSIDKPKIFGDETDWFVMNDLDTAASRYTYGRDPIGLEIQCTVFGFKDDDILKNVVFKRYLIINKGNNLVEDIYLGYWSDPDLGDGDDDFIGCDTSLNVTYCYNGDNIDGSGAPGHYGTPPPALGYVLLQGPIFKANQSDSARFNGGWKRGYLNYDMTSSKLYLNASLYWGLPDQGDPIGAVKWHQYLSGLNWLGEPMIDPITGEETRFMVPGDPVNQEGWYEGDGWPGGPRPGNMFCNFGSGPFNFAPGDTQEVVIAIVMAKGYDYLNSITVLKEYITYVQHYYTDEIFKQFSSPKWHAIPQKFELFQNYPNPFNSSTKIDFLLYKTQRVKIEIYNILGQRIDTIVDKIFPEGRHVVDYTAENISSGLYFYKIKTEEFHDVKKMILIR